MSKYQNSTRIKDIARLAGVSKGTVDRVIHNRGEVAEETKTLILEIINKLEYTPNLIARSLASKKLYKIAVLIPDASKNNPYWEKPLIGIRRAQEEIKNFNGGIDLFFFDLDNRESLILEFKKLLRTHPDGLVFSPMFYNTSLEIVKSCEEKGIPYIFMDVNIEGCNNLAFFGQDSRQSGFLAAKLMYYGLPDRAKILVLKMADREGTLHHLARRESGFSEYFELQKAKKQVSISTMNLDLTSKNSIDLFLKEKLLNGFGINGIFVPNSRSYKVAKFLESTNVSEIILVGYDLVDDNLHYLEKGFISFLIGQKPEEQGYKSVISLFNYLFTGKQIEKINYSPIEIIMKENMDYYRNIKM